MQEEIKAITLPALQKKKYETTADFSFAMLMKFSSFLDMFMMFIVYLVKKSIKNPGF